MTSFFTLSKNTKKISLLALLLLLSACSEVAIRQELDAQTEYKREIKIDYEGKSYEGAAVLPIPKSGLYNLNFKTDNDTYLLAIRSCHREIVEYNKGKSFSFAYNQTGFIENKGACPIEILALSESGRHAFGFIDFEQVEYKLAGYIKCNGKILSTLGVSLCQSKTGMISEVGFMQEVDFIMPTCAELKLVTDYERGIAAYRYKMPKGKCVIAFKGKKSGEIQRHTILGYDDLILRIK